MKKYLIAFIAFDIIFAVFIISTLNQMVNLDEETKSKWSQVLNNYQRRADLIPNLVETVKGFAAHEKDTLTQVTEARAKATQTKISIDDLSNVEAMQKFTQNQGELSAALSRLMVVVEKYPELKSDENFLLLQNSLEGTENRIAVARRDYIEAIKEFNIKIRTIPTKWVVALFSDLEPKATFEIDESATHAPQVDFSEK